MESGDTGTKHQPGDSRSGEGSQFLPAGLAAKAARCSLLYRPSVVDFQMISGHGVGKSLRERGVLGEDGEIVVGDLFGGRPEFPLGDFGGDPICAGPG